MPVPVLLTYCAMMFLGELKAPEPKNPSERSVEVVMSRLAKLYAPPEENEVNTPTLPVVVPAARETVVAALPYTLVAGPESITQPPGRFDVEVALAVVPMLSKFSPSVRFPAVNVVVAMPRCAHPPSAATAAAARMVLAPADLPRRVDLRVLFSVFIYRSPAPR